MKRTHRIAVTLLAVYAIALAGSSTAYAGHPKPDPQPSHGQDCLEHGNGGVNEDHCASASPSSTPVPSASQTPAPTPTATSPATPSPAPSTEPTPSTTASTPSASTPATSLATLPPTATITVNQERGNPILLAVAGLFGLLTALTLLLRPSRRRW